jgi:hypothetical protein
MTDIFGQVIIGSELEQAVVDTLESWFPVYIRELELQTPADPNPNHIPEDALPLPRSYLTAAKVDRSMTDQLPAIVVVNPGLSGRNAPKQNGDGTFRVPWGISVGAFVTGKDRPSTSRLIRAYTAIIRMIMLQKQSLGGFADGTTWLDESYDDNFAFVDQQTIGAGSVVFEVWVDNVVNRYGGPATYGGPAPGPDPAAQPGADWPEVEVVVTDVGTEVT